MVSVNPDFKHIPVGDLELDRDNPRLPSTLKRESDEEILRYLAGKTNIEDLITSIGKNKFFPGEAIVVTPSDTTDGKYTVLEGNRRLTALKFLQDPELAGSISTSAKTAVDGAQHKPTVVPAYEVGSRDDVLQYLGFRHISGVQRWEPLAKARYLKKLYQQSEGTPDMRYRQIASEIGSRSDTVRKNLDALAAYEVVDKNGFFGIEELNEDTFHFGVFYTALSNSIIADFTGARNDPVENPQTLDTQAIKELTFWMFQKDADRKTKLGESRNIPTLAAVVSTPKALALLRGGATLKDAYEETPDIQNELIREIETATYYIKAANTRLESMESVSPEVHKAISRLAAELEMALAAVRRKNAANHASGHQVDLQGEINAGA